MNEENYMVPSLRACPIYEPGRPIEEVAREKNLDPSAIVKLASNENPIGPSPLALEAVNGVLPELNDYPDGGSWNLRQGLARELELDPGQILPSNGSNEVLEMLAATYLQPGTNAVMGEFGFVVYRLATIHARAEVRAVPMPDLVHDLGLFREAIDADTRVVFLARPNNPTGDSVDARALIDFVGSLPEHVIFCLDEAYVEYLENAPDLRPMIHEGKRIVCTRTFSKIHGLAGLRIGYAYGHREIIRNLQRVRQPFNVSSVAQVAALAALRDHRHIENTRNLNRESLAELEAGLQALGVPIKTGEANFVLADVGRARECFEGLLGRGIIIRPLDGYGLSRWIRVSTGTIPQTEKFLEVFGEWWEESGND